MNRPLMLHIASQNLFSRHGEYLAYQRIEALERFRSFDHFFLGYFIHIAILSRIRSSKRFWPSDPHRAKNINLRPIRCYPAVFRCSDNSETEPTKRKEQRK